MYSFHLQALAAYQQQKLEMKSERNFWDYVMGLPVERQAAAWNAYKEAKEKSAESADRERRHREMVQAIRQAGRDARTTIFW